jgi:hypothetical protein
LTTVDYWVFLSNFAVKPNLGTTDSLTLANAHPVKTSLVAIYGDFLKWRIPKRPQVSTIKGSNHLDYYLEYPQFKTHPYVYPPIQATMTSPHCKLKTNGAETG